MSCIRGLAKRSVVVAAVGGAAVVLAAGSSAAPRASKATPLACETPGLVIWLDTQGNGAAGSIYYKLEFTNLSSHSCTLNGFPYVNAVSITNGVLGKTAAFTHTTPHSVTIKAGHTVTATLQIVEAGNFTASKCKPTTAAGLRVYPPNQQRAKTVPFPFAACSAAHGPVYLRVTPVT